MHLERVGVDVVAVDEATEIRYYDGVRCDFNMMNGPWCAVSSFFCGGYQTSTSSPTLNFEISSRFKAWWCAVLC